MLVLVQAVVRIVLLCCVVVYTRQVQWANVGKEGSCDQQTGYKLPTRQTQREGRAAAAAAKERLGISGAAAPVLARPGAAARKERLCKGVWPITPPARRVPLIDRASLWNAASIMPEITRARSRASQLFCPRTPAQGACHSQPKPASGSPFASFCAHNRRLSQRCSSCC